MEKLWDGSSIKSKLFQLEVEVKNVKYISFVTYSETDLCVIYKTITFYFFSFQRKRSVWHEDVLWSSFYRYMCFV